MKKITNKQLFMRWSVIIILVLQICAVDKWVSRQKYTKRVMWGLVRDGVHFRVKNKTDALCYNIKRWINEEM